MGTDETKDGERGLSIYSRIEKDLRGKIARGEFPGGRLPPERSLAEEYGVNRLTLRKALANLFDEGLVAKMGRRGTYAADQAPAAKIKTARRVLAVFAGGARGGYFDQLFDALRDEFAARGAELNLLYASEPDDIDATLLRNAVRKDVDGVVLAGYMEQALLEKIKRTKLPCSLVGETPKPCEIEKDFDQVAEDSAEYSAAAARKLVEGGCKRIGLLDGTLANQWSKTAKAAFLETLRKAGLEAAFVLNMKDESARAGMKAARELEAKRVDGLFIRSESIARGVLDALLLDGVKIPGALSIITFGHPDDSVRHLGLPRFESRPALLAKEAAALLLSRVENPSAAPRKKLLRAAFRNG